MSSPRAVTLSYNDFPSRDYRRLNWLTIAALSSQTFSWLIRPFPNSTTCMMRKLMRRPFPGGPGSDPMTVPVIRCSRIIASFVMVTGQDFLYSSARARLTAHDARGPEI
jgi:hypothetical protein